MTPPHDSVISALSSLATRWRAKRAMFFWCASNPPAASNTSSKKSVQRQTCAHAAPSFCKLSTIDDSAGSPQNRFRCAVVRRGRAGDVAPLPNSRELGFRFPCGRLHHRNSALGGLGIGPAVPGLHVPSDALHAARIDHAPGRGRPDGVAGAGQHRARRGHRRNRFDLRDVSILGLRTDRQFHLNRRHRNLDKSVALCADGGGVGRDDPPRLDHRFGGGDRGGRLRDRDGGVSRRRSGDHQ